MSAARRDLIVLAAACIAVFVLFAAIPIDPFERFVEFSRAHASWKLDDLAATGVLLVAGLGVFALRRWREVKRESGLRSAKEVTTAQDQRLLRTLIDALPDYIFVKDAEGRFVLSNLAHARAVNAPHAEALVGKTAFDFFPPELAAQFDADDRAMMESGQPLISQERQTVDAAGHRIWVATTKVPLRDGQGKVTGLVGISRDITARRQAEAALRESETRYRLVASATSDAIWEWNFATDEIRWGGAVESLFGYGQDAIQLTMEWWSERIHPEDRANVMNSLQAALDTGENYWTGEYRFQRADGSYAAVIDRGFVERDADGQALRMIGSMMDVTERRRVIDALRESEARFRQIVEMATEGICTTDREARITFANRRMQEMLGYSEAELIGRSLPEFMDQQAEVSSEGWDYRFVRKDGTKLWGIMSAAPFVDKDQVVTSVLVMLTDITERKQAEDALRESEARFRVLFEHSPDAILLIDPHHPTISWPIVDCNDAACVMNGFTREEMIGQSIDILHGGPLDMAERAAFLERLRQGAVVDIEVVHYRKNGTPFPIHAHIALVNLNGREIVLGIDRDITERKQAEDALRESEARFRVLFESSPDAILLIDPHHPTISWPIVDCNEAACVMNGFTREEMIGRSIDILHEAEADLIERTAYLKSIRQAGVLQLEARHQRKDGRIVNVQIHTSLVNVNGRELVLGIDRDVTRQKLAEERLRESEERFRATFEQAAVGIGHLDLEGRYLRVNEKYCDILGFSREELFGLTWQEITYPEDLERNLEQQHALLAGEVQTYHIEKRYMHQEGLWVNLTVSLVRKPSGEPDYIVAVIEDISERKRIEAALRESEERFRATFEQAAVGITHTDMKGRHIRVNQKYCEILGYSLEEALTLNWTDITYLDDLHEDVTSFLKLTEGEIPTYSMEKRMHHKDGHLVWVNMTTSLVRTLEGEPDYSITVIEDITARKQIEAALANERNLLRTLIDNLPDFIFVKDTESRFITTNEAGWRGFGVGSLDALIGKSDFDFLPHDVAARHHADEQRIFQTGEAMLEREEITFERATGRYIWVLTNKMPLRDSDGNIYGLVGIGRDITERKRAEEALRESEAKFRELAENLHLGIWLRDVETNQTLYTNPAYTAIFGDDRDNLLGEPERFRAVVHPEDVAGVEALQRTHPVGGINHENRLVQPDGTIRWVRVRSFPVHNAEGKPYRVVGFAEDITERKQIEAQQVEMASERARMKVVEQFVQNASHDLRTPLTILQTSAYLLAKASDPDRRQRHLENLEEQIAHITGVLQDFLDLSRLDQLTYDFQPEPCDASALVNSVYGELQAMAKRKQHEIHLNLDAHLPPVMGVVAELQRAFRHLIVNALNYTPDGGQIDIATFQLDDHVVVEVWDNGIGISAEEIPFIFERFYRADKARSTDTGGSGLGLAITKKIIEAHRGTIEVESAPGEGSTFRVFLPVNPGADETT